MLRKIAVLYLLMLFSFMWGIATVQFHIFPWNILGGTVEELSEYLTFQVGNEKSIADRILLNHQEFRTAFQTGGFIRKDNQFKDTGYLLISRFSGKFDQVVIELFDIAHEKVIHRWLPNVNKIFELAPVLKKKIKSRSAFYAQHPLLLQNGDIIFSTGEGPLIRIDTAGEPVWVNDGHFHHSIEFDANGNIVVPVVVQRNDNEVIPFRDDGFAVIDLNGNIIGMCSIAEWLIKNGYRGLLYGVGEFQRDRIHLNDAQPINENIGNYLKGDIAWSSRHLSAVGVLRPSTGKMLWVKVGPWLAQHDINILNDATFSIFGNDIGRINSNDPLVKIDGLPVEPWINSSQTSDIYIYDPVSSKITTPFSKMMVKHRIGTKSSGRSRILKNGDVYIEETDNGRLIRMSSSQIRWQYINLQPEKKTIGALYWSRYLSKNEVDLAWKKG